MVQKKQTRPRLWKRLRLRGRLLVMMLTVALAAVLICALSFGITYYRMLTLSQEHAQTLSSNVHRMVEMAFYQQETHIREVYTVAQAKLLDRRLSELAAEGSAPDWDVLLMEAYELIDDMIYEKIEGYDGSGNLDTEGAAVFIWDGESLYVRGTDPQTFMEMADNFYKRMEEQGYTVDGGLMSDLHASEANAAYIKGEDGMLLAWYSFGEDQYRIGMFVPNTGALQMSLGLQELMGHETGLTLEKMEAAAWQSVLGLLLAIVALLLILPLASNKLALAVVNPVEREQDHQRKLLRIAEEEKAMLEQLDKLKTEFLGNASHEMKTPLTVISGYAQLVKKISEKEESLDGPEVSRRMTLISSEAERLSLMVGQILDVTRMEEGRMVMEQVRCYVEEIIHSAVRTHYPILNKNRNRLDIRIESGLPAVYADPARISQVIVNLISNAVRFTADGEITVSAKRKDGGVLVCVSDTGCGIEAERLPRIFERYNKKKKTDGGQDTGTGLGLYICKHIIEQHGGVIWVESEEGHGTSVFFTLPGID